MDIWKLEIYKILLVQKFAYISINWKFFLSSNLIETYIVEKHKKRPTTCANIISKFEVFECNFQVLSNFLSNFRNIASLRFWTPFASFPFATVCEAQLRLCVKEYRILCNLYCSDENMWKGQADLIWTLLPNATSVHYGKSR